ncbi:MAG: sulfatase [bacterium]
MFFISCESEGPAKTKRLPDQTAKSSARDWPGDSISALFHPDRHRPRKININGVVKNAVALDDPVRLRPCREEESLQAALGMVPGSTDRPVEFRLSCGDRTEKFEVDPKSSEGWKHVSPSMCPCESGVRVSAGLDKPGAFLAHPSFEKPGPGRLVAFIIIDALRADDLGVYGRKPSPSPELDKLARRGTVFQRAYTASPFTLTSVASIFTGLFPWQHNVMFTEKEGLVLADSVPKLVERFHKAGYHTAAFSGTYFLMSRNGYAEGFDHFDEACASSFFRESADCLNRRIIPWIKRHRNQDVFLYIHYIDPHAPYYPPEAFRKRHVGNMEKPFFEDVAVGEIGQFGSHRAWYQFWRSPSDYDLEYLRALYRAEIEYVDDRVGKLISELEQSRQASGNGSGKSVYLVTADHGEAFYEHEVMDHVADLHEPVMRVPLIMFGHGVPKGMTVTEQVRTIDFMPSLLEIEGLESPDQVPGRSMVPLLEGRGGEARPAAAVHFLGMEPEYALVMWPWKIFFRPDDDELELYNLEDDPPEKNDLADTNMEKRKEMQGLLRALLALPDAGEEKAEPVDQKTRQRLKALGYR